MANKSRVDGSVCTFDPNTSAVADYLHSIVNVEQHPTLSWIRSETSRRFPRWAMMTSSIDTARLLSTLVCTTGARRVVEIGTFTGYSSLAMAWSMSKQDGSKVVCLDNSEEFTQVAREAWKRAEVDSIIELRLGDAADSLKRLVDDPQWLGKVDMVYIDADKKAQWHYFEQAMKLLRQRGLIVVDNTIWFGAVLNPSDSSGVRLFNEKVAKDERCQSVLLPFSDGITIACKK